VEAGRVRTPSSEVGIVAGITRSLVLDIARAEAIPVVEEAFFPADVAGADEAFITSTTRGVLPVTRVDARPVGDGRVGPITRRLIDAFRAEVDRIASK